jgi:OOP family OmpA-OmpF porin
MKKIILYYIVLFIGQGAYAQYDRNYRELGDKAYAKKEYYEAAYFYEKAAAGMNITPATEVPFQGSPRKTSKVKPSDKAYLSYQLGQSHRLYENYQKAKPWYVSVLSENHEASYPDTRLWYGICLRATGDFEEAAKQLNQYVMIHSGTDSLGMLARKELDNCTFAIRQFRYPVLAKVAPVKSMNGDGSNYALIRKDGNSWFTSSRMDKESEKRINRIYMQAKGASNVDRLLIPDESRYKEAEYGTPSLHPSGKYMYLTRWYKEGNTIVREVVMSARENENSWGKPVLLSQVNVKGSSAMQPCVTADGKKLYYASDKPGGQGGFDIWMSELDDAGQAMNATNLGNPVNTMLDEQAPYADMVNSRLVFSSKGHTGIGGFDLFESSMTGSAWSMPVNMGFPVNSQKDDIYFFPDENDSRKFYLSSDRESVCCLEIMEVTDQRYIVKGLVIDCDTKKALSGVRVSLQDASTRITERETVSDSGVYTFPIVINKPYNLVFEKEQHFVKVVALPDPGNERRDTVESKEVCIQGFTIGKAIVINNVLYDFNASELRPESKEVLDGLVATMQDNPNIKVELGSHTDGIGKDEYNLKLSQARAEACVAYIISKGIPEDRIFARGYGKSKPIAPNTKRDGSDNPEGRQLNRRTEFTVLSTGATTSK